MQLIVYKIIDDVQNYIKILSPLTFTTDVDEALVFTVPVSGSISELSLNGFHLGQKPPK